MTHLERAAELENEVKASMMAWDIEELVRLNDAAEALREEGIYDTKALNQFSRLGY